MHFGKLQTSDHLSLSACAFNFGFCALGKLCNFYCERFCDLASAEDLYSVEGLLQKTCFNDSSLVNHCAAFKLSFKIAYVNSRIYGCEILIVKSALRDTYCQLCLTAFKSGLNSAAG